MLMQRSADCGEDEKSGWVEKRGDVGERLGWNLKEVEVAMLIFGFSSLLGVF